MTVRPLDLNLASRPFRNNTLIWSVVLLAGLGLGLFTAWNVKTFVENGRLLSDLKSTVSSIDSRIDDLERRDREARRAIREFDLATLTTQADKANDVIQWKAFSWTKLFNLLEHLQPYDVKLQSLRPVFYASELRRQNESNPEGSVPVKTQGVAKTYEAFLEFQRSLLLDTHFGAIEPLRKSTLDSKEELFELNFLYYPEGSDEASVYIEPVVPFGSPSEFDRIQAEKDRKKEEEKKASEPKPGDSSSASPADGQVRADGASDAPAAPAERVEHEVDDAWERQLAGESRGGR